MASGTLEKPFSKAREIGSNTFFEFGIGNVPKTETSNVHLANSWRGLMCTFGVSSNLLGLYQINVSSSGTVTTLPIVPASDLTITKTTNQITIANANTSYAAILNFIVFNGGAPSFVT